MPDLPCINIRKFPMKVQLWRHFVAHVWCWSTGIGEERWEELIIFWGVWITINGWMTIKSLVCKSRCFVVIGNPIPFHFNQAELVYSVKRQADLTPHYNISCCTKCFLRQHTSCKASQNFQCILCKLWWESSLDNQYSMGPSLLSVSTPALDLMKSTRWFRCCLQPAVAVV